MVAVHECVAGIILVLKNKFTIYLFLFIDFKFYNLFFTRGYPLNFRMETKNHIIVTKYRNYFFF